MAKLAGSAVRASSSFIASACCPESFNATAKRPLLYTGLLNDPRRPLYFPVDSGTLPRNDYLGVTMAPDGTPWVGLVKLLSTKPDAEL